MKKFLSLLVKTFLIALFLGLLILSLEWLVGWRSTTQFSNGLFMVGAVLIAVGIFSALGSLPIRDDLQILWAESIGDFHVWERSQRWLAGMMTGFPGYSLLIMTGIYLVGFAVLVPQLF
jgi:hypothetical protein